MADKFKVRRKPCIDLADVAADEMPKCSTPDGEETEVQIISVGRSPRTRSQSRSHSRTNSWNRSRTPQSFDLEADAPVGTPDGSAAGGIVSKVMAMFRPHNSDEGAEATSSVIVSVEMLREEHTAPAQDPRLDPEHRRWRNLKGASMTGQKEDLETGL